MSNDYERVVAKAKCEENHLFFTRYFFKARQALKFIVNWHHVLMCDAIEDVIQGRTENLIINVAPGASKTEIVVINFIARGLALNPRARFLHLSGSDSLASLNSATAREIIRSDEYQELWPLQIADDAKAKKRWNVLVDGQPAGGVYATSLGGQVTGFRAGHMAPGFQGAILIDDPIKPEDAFSPSKLQAANRKLVTTVKSRKANPKTPIVIVMQRIAESDPVGFIEKGGLPGRWKMIRIPAVIDEAYVKALRPRYRDLIGKAESHEGRFSYWPYKEPIQELLAMEAGQGTDQSGQRISRHVFSSQYNQSPVALGGNIIHGECFHLYRELPKLRWRKIFADTAQKTKEANDFSVFEEWGFGFDGKIYLIDMVRGKWEAPELQKRALAFWSQAKGRDAEKYGALRKMVVEDKSSGTGLIQTLKLPPYCIPIEPIERDKDRFTRVNDALPYIEVGAVCLPEDAPFTQGLIQECEAFTADDSHDFDDQIDPLCDAVMDMLSSGNKVKQWVALGKKG
jgi:predicted phage terminase large subunit-like protein